MRFWRSHDGMLMNSGDTAADGVLDKMRASRSDDDVRQTMAEFGRILSEDSSRRLHRLARNDARRVEEL